MSRQTDIEAHESRAAEARRRIALAAVLSEPTTTRTEGEAASIVAGARAYLWLVAGIDRDSSGRFIDRLCDDFGQPVVLSAAVDLCQNQPPGPKAWLRQACRLRAGKTATVRP